MSQEASKKVLLYFLNIVDPKVLIEIKWLQRLYLGPPQLIGTTKTKFVRIIETFSSHQNITAVDNYICFAFVLKYLSHFDTIKAHTEIQKFICTMRTFLGNMVC